jgi:RNA polymerase sigma factor (sigma-70 family)
MTDIEEERFEELDFFINKLPQEHQYVLRLRYGLDDNKKMTLDSIAAILNCHRERVRNIIGKAERRLRYYYFKT